MINAFTAASYSTLLLHREILLHFSPHLTIICQRNKTEYDEKYEWKKVYMYINIVNKIVTLMVKKLYLYNRNVQDLSTCFSIHEWSTN